MPEAVTAAGLISSTLLTLVLLLVIGEFDIIPGCAIEKDGVNVILHEVKPC